MKIIPRAVRGSPGPAREATSRKRRVIKWLCLAALLVFLVDAVWYEPFHPVLTTYDVAIPGLPPSLDGFRAVQLSDFHRSRFVSRSLIFKAVDMANGTHADVALLTGDFVSRNQNRAAECCRILRGLHTSFGSYAVLGNHDYWTDSRRVRKALADSGITLLTNAHARLHNGLSIVGVDDEWSGAPDVDVAYKGMRAGDCRIMMCHEPSSIRRFAGRTGLLITGHTHGGQVNLPLITQLLLRYVHHCAYQSGWYREGGILMYVNRGLGTVFPNIRFRCRPEVTLFILHPTSKTRPYVVR